MMSSIIIFMRVKVVDSVTSDRILRQAISQQAELDEDSQRLTHKLVYDSHGHLLTH